jgi:hypothetical protein
MLKARRDVSHMPKLSMDDGTKANMAIIVAVICQVTK